MKCTACGAEISGAVCPQCGLDTSDNTGVFNLEDNPVEAAIDVTNLPTGSAVLVVVRGPSSGEVWPLEETIIDVGRSADSKLFLDDITVSRKHAVFRKVNSGWTLEDSGSLNGSYINRNLISEPTDLKNGDEIQLGKFRFTFHEGGK